MLELGTGPAWITTKLAQARPTWKITGVDASELMLEKAKACALKMAVSIDWVHADARETNLISESYNLIISHFAFSEFPDPKYVARDITRLLKTGRLLYLQDMATSTNPLGRITKQAVSSLKGAYSEEELSAFFSRSELASKMTTAMKWAGGLGRAWAVRPV